MSRSRGAGFSRVDIAATPHRRSVGHQDGEALLAMPQPRTRTARQKAEAAARAAAEQQDAATLIRRLANRHGCTRLNLSDPPCTREGHDADVAAAREVLEVCGLLGDQSAKPP